jgi:hypothetical protein
VRPVASLRGRRLQVALSSFGIATGIAAVVLLVSIVSGMHRYAIEQFSAGRGQHHPRQRESGTVHARSRADLPATMRLSDVDAGDGVGPVLQRGDGGQLRLRRAADRERSAQGANIRGIHPSGFELLDVKSERGTVLSAARVRDGFARRRARR